MRLIATLRRRLARQEGFTMPAVMAGMFVVMLIGIAAIASASGDINLARDDQDDKQAFAAAEAGINDYLGNLNTDTNFWAKCTTGVGVSPVNDKGVTNAARKWRPVPGSPNSEYSIELIPAPGYSACSTTNAVASMVDDGNIKIRSTGRVVKTLPGTATEVSDVRTVTATFRRAGFLDFLYYTDFENQDPTYIQRTDWARGSRATNSNGDPIPGADDLAAWGADKCQRHWWGTQAGGEGRREKPTWRGQYLNASGTYAGDAKFDFNNRYDDVDTDDFCGEITFVTGDEVNGPFHSNDEILVSGSPTFGTLNGNDRVEISGEDYRPQSANPVFRPTLRTGAAELEPPATNSSLEAVTDPGYVFEGQTEIKLDNTTMKVTNANLNGGAETVLSWPPSGVVYARNGTCGTRYNPIKWNTKTPGCGDVRISGTYNKDLTVAAMGDIIVTGNVTRQTATSTALLGLISDQFVRVAHVVDRPTGPSDTDSYTSCDETAGSPTNMIIHAAILTLSGSFTVDNYWCGSALGNLTVEGAIAQRHRGVVGTGNGNTGYLKKYSYNQDLKFRSPPHFLDPLQASWRILRQGEQSPACTTTVRVPDPATGTPTVNGACLPGIQ